MINFLKNEHKLLFVILFTGAFLRLGAPSIGSPILYLSNDEAIYHLSALNMLAKLTPFTLTNYGPLGPYVQLPFIGISYIYFFIIGKIHSLVDFKLLLLTQEGSLLLIPRLISGVFSVMSIWISYNISKELFKSKSSAIFSSLLCAVSFNMVFIAHQARPWAPALFFNLLAIWLVLKSVNGRKHELKNVCLAYLASGISFGFHQISGINIILILLIRLSKYGFSIKKLFNKNEFAALLLWLGLVIAFSYLSVGLEFFELLNPTSKRGSIAGFMRIPSDVLTVQGFNQYLFSIETYLDFIKALFLPDLLITITTFISTIFFLKNSSTFIAIKIFLIVSLLLSLFVFLPFVRYFLPAFVLFPILGAESLVRLMKTRYKTIIPILLLLSSFNSLYWNYILFQEPTFTQIRDWLQVNVPTETPISITERRFFGYVPTASAAAVIRKFKPSYFKTVNDIVGNKYLDNIRNVVYLNEFSNSDKETNLLQALKDYPIEYVIDPYFSAKDSLYLNIKKVQLTRVAFFTPTFSGDNKNEIPSILHDSGAIFRGRYNHPYALLTVNRAGPYYDVLKIEKNNNQQRSK